MMYITMWRMLSPKRRAFIAPARLVARAVCASWIAVAVLSTGCGEWQFDWETGRFYRPHTAPIRPGSAQGAPEPAVYRDTQPVVAEDPQFEPTAPPDEPADQGYHQLLLVSEPAEGAAESHIHRHTLSRATARQVGQLLALLYRPVGPGGTEHRYYLIYPTYREVEEALKMAPQLDVSADATADRPGGGDQQARFQRAVVTFYQVAESMDPGPARLLAADLADLADVPELSSPRRWAALMIAGRVQADILGDLAASQETFRRAREAVSAGSIESLMAGASRVEGLTFLGLRDEAMDEAKQLVVEHQAFADTAAYTACLRVARGDE